jgi:hypothetical protein
VLLLKYRNVRGGLRPSSPARNQMPHIAPLSNGHLRKRRVVHGHLARRGCVTGNNCERVLQQVNERAKTGTPDAVRFPRALWQRKNDDSRGAAAAEEPRDDPR